MALIQVHGATKRYGETVALDEVSLGLETGGCLALIGESGSGKTTLLRAINGLTRLDRGQVLVRGTPVTEQEPRRLRRSIGYVQQDGGLIPHWSVLRNAALVPTLLGRDDARAAGREALDAVGLGPAVYGDRFPRELSGGQRQRVAIARAMAASPDILLMDEPFGALDAITRAEVQETFGRLRTATGVTTVFVTHDLREAFALATAILVLKDGAAVARGTPGELRADPHPYVGELLAKAGLAA